MQRHSDSSGLLYSVLRHARQLRSVSCTHAVSDSGPVEMRSRLELGRLLQMQGVTGKLWEMLPPSLTVLDIRTSGFECTALAHLTALQSLSLQRVGAGQRSWSALDESVPEMCSRCCLHGFSLMPQPCLSRQEQPQPMPGAFSWTTRLQSLELQRCVLGARQKLPESLEKLTFSNCLLNPLHLSSRLRSLCISRCGFAQLACRPRTAGGTADPGDPGYSLPKLHLPAHLQHLDFTTCHEFGLTQWPRAVVLKSAGCDFLAASCWGHGSDRSVCLCASSANGRSSASAAAARPAALQADSSSDSSADGMDCSPDTPAAKMVVDVPDLVFPPDSALKEVSVARRCWLVVRQLPKSLCGLNLHEHNYGMDDTSAFPEGGAAPGVINLTSFTSLTKLHLAGQRAHFLLPAQPLDMLVAMLHSSSSVLVGLPPLPCRPLPVLDLAPRLPLRHPAARPARKRQRRSTDRSAAAAPQLQPVATPPTRFQYSKVVLYRYKSTLHSGGGVLQTSLLSWPTALHIAHLSLRGFHHDDLSDASLSHIESLFSVSRSCQD